MKALGVWCRRSLVGKFTILITGPCTFCRSDLHRWLILFNYAGPGMLFYWMRIVDVKWMEVNCALKKEGGSYPYCCRGRRTERAIRSRNRKYLAEQK